MVFWKLKWQDGTEETRREGDALFSIDALIDDRRLLEKMEVCDEASHA